MNTEGRKLVRFVEGPRKGRYHIQVDAENRWGFSLISENGFVSPGGFDFGVSAWVISKRKWPKWAFPAER